MANPKKQNTLYRFVSLRAPELSKKEDSEKRFVFHPDNHTGEFFDAVTEAEPEQTNWEVLQIAADAFTEIQTLEELQSINSSFYLMAEWLAKNRKRYAKDIRLKTEHVTVLSSAVVYNLWDNLFYQVITQKSFYIKEGIIQMLVLQNLLKHIQLLVDDDEKEQIIPSLASARVVLPLALFDQQGINSSLLTTETQPDTPELTKDILDAHKSAVAKLNIENYDDLILELQKVSIKFQKERDQAFSAAKKAHQDIIDPILQTYRDDYYSLKREMCDLPLNENYNPKDFCNQPDIKYPILPKFVFVPKKETDESFLEENLTEKAFQTLTAIVDLDEVDTIVEIIELLKEKSKTEHQAIASTAKFSEKILMIGDVAVTVDSSPSKGVNSFGFRICPNHVSNTLVNFVMTIFVPDNSYSVLAFNYTITKSGGSNISSSVYESSTANNIITITKMFGATSSGTIAGVPHEIPDLTGIIGTITLSNGVQTFVLDMNLGTFKLKECTSGFLTKKESVESETGGTFIPKGFGFRQLGIADYKKVVSEVCCYDAGEVAHIENIMAREIREKITTKTHRTEVTEVESTEIETEKLADTISTERFEMQTEIARLLAEQNQTSAFANVHANFTGGYLDAGAAYANNTTKEESNRQAVIQAKELTQRAMERIVSRVKNEKTVKVTDEFIEENKHGFDNTQSNENVSGVYRFVNVIYKNQIFNYGKRLMYEFMIPQPSKLHRLGMAVSKTSENAVLLEKPIDPRIAYPTFSTINEGNYQLLASQYNAEVNVYPVPVVISKSFSGTTDLNYNDTTNNLSGQAKSESVDLPIPEGFYTAHAKIITDYAYDTVNSNYNSYGFSVGNILVFNPGTSLTIDTELAQSDYTLKSFSKSISVGYQSLAIVGFNISISIKCFLSDQGRAQWQKETYNAIIEGYEEQLRLYNESLAQAKNTGVQILESNPLFYREIEKLVLRKNCISYLIDDTNPNSKRRFGQKMYNADATFKNHQVTISQDMDDYGSFAKFMEQAFEWNLMSYNFYPFYWGDRDDWHELYQSEVNDPIFRSFMQSGMARVVVTVKPGFEDAVMHYMALGQIWNGGQLPVLGDPLYLSIVDELKEQEYEVEETWETVLPTHLIALQEDGVALAESGLPCGDDCKDGISGNLKSNDNKLGVTPIPKTP